MIVNLYNFVEFYDISLLFDFFYVYIGNKIKVYSFYRFCIV